MRPLPGAGKGSRASGRGRQMPRSTVDAGRCRAPQQGSDPTAAGGGEREGSEWPRSIADEAAPSVRKISGTATGGAPLPGGASRRLPRLCEPRNDILFCYKRADTRMGICSFMLNSAIILPKALPHRESLPGYTWCRKFPDKRQRWRPACRGSATDCRYPASGRLKDPSR